MPIFRERQRGVESSGEGKAYHKTPPSQNGLDPPPTIRFPTPFVHALSFSLEEAGTDQTNPTFRGLQNWFWRALSIARSPPPPYSTFPPPPKSQDTFCSPIGHFPRLSAYGGDQHSLAHPGASTIPLPSWTTGRIFSGSAQYWLPATCGWVTGP